MPAQEKPRMFIVEGVIQALRVAPGIVNLVEDIQKGAFWTGAAAGLVGEAGASAIFASLAVYDGEEVEHMALLVNGQLAIGTFEWLRDLMVGDDVRLVVSESDSGPLFVHAILRKNDQLLWTPFSVNHTRRGWILHGIKLGLLGFLGMFLMFGSFYLFDKESRPEGPWLLFGILFTVSLISFVVYMSTASVMQRGDYAEEIFQTLDIPQFHRFRIKPFSVFNIDYGRVPDAFRKNYIFHFADALVSHKQRLNLP